MDKITSKYRASRKILETLKDYVEFISQKIQVDTDELDDLENVKMATHADTITAIYTAYADTSKFVVDLDAILARLSDIKISDVDSSDTFRIEMRELFNKTRAKFAAFKASVAQIDVDIVQELSSVIVDKATADPDLLAVLATIRKLYHANRSSVSLYALIFQKLLDIYYITNKPVAFAILNYIELDKNMALETPIQDETYINPITSVKHAKPRIRKPRTTNPPQHRFGLIPVMDPQPLKELLPVILAEEGKAIDTFDLGRLSKKLSVGFIVLNRIVYTPVEFDIRPLIVKEIAEPFIQPAEYGINTKQVVRFNTIKEYRPTDKWDFSTVIHNADATRFYVLETLDGKTYRPLAPWVHSNKYSLARFRVEKLLEYTPGKPSRAMNYHQAQTRVATQNMFLSKALDMDTFEERHSDVESGKLRSVIYDAVMLQIQAVCKSEYKSDISTGTDVSNILHDPSVMTAFYTSVVSNYTLGMNNSFDAGKFPLSEVLVSFICELQTASRRFAREVHNGYSRAALRPEDLTGNKESRLATAMKKMSDVVQDAILFIIKLDENIYTSIYYKYLILNHAV